MILSLLLQTSIDMTETEALIALNLIPDIGGVRLKNLMEAFGSAPKIFLSSEEKLKRIDKINGKIANAIRTFAFENLNKELELCRKSNIKVITLIDQEYPKHLKNIYGAPLCIYLKGEISLVDELSLAIVGSRRASFYGLSCAKEFSYSLAKLGVTIVSGLARGVDTEAHKGALKAQGRTIAVLGSGLNCIYPPENKRLAEDIANSGAVISEFPVDTKPLAMNFPRRNRIISGLSLGVIVVEAARNSGALITADFAIEQGRDVFAIPGKVDSQTSYGTNRLIKQGAKLTDCLEDIIEEIMPRLSELKGKGAVKSESRMSEEDNSGSEKKVETAATVLASLTNDEKIVYNVITSKPRYVDEIIQESSFQSAKVMSILLKLEIESFIKQLPGKMFVRVGG